MKSKILFVASAVLMIAALYMVFIYVPTDREMGIVPTASADLKFVRTERTEVNPMKRLESDGKRKIVDMKPTRR